ncbi:hypothetical protein OQA88_12530 [Cercophora sp. LCS_1]
MSAESDDHRQIWCQDVKRQVRASGSGHIQHISEPGGQKRNLQVQVNNQTKISVRKRITPQTVSGPALAPSDGSWSVEETREKLKESNLLRKKKDN